MRQPVTVASVRHVLEEAVGIGVGQRAVLAPALDVIATLDVMEAAECAPVGPGVDPSLVVELDPEGVAAALRKQLEDVALGMIAPDCLPEEIGCLAIAVYLDL